jgi:hypothetical protein
MGSVLFPGCIRRWPGENGLRIWVEGDPSDSRTHSEAVAVFQTVLGVLRAWCADAGILRDESRGGLGDGAVRDDSGNQWLKLGTAVYYETAKGDIEVLSVAARRGIEVSQNLRNALWLNGRANRTAADFYMIHEYAEQEFGGAKGVSSALGLSVKSQNKLTRSANNLSPLSGGRHAQGNSDVVMALDEQQEYVARLVYLWISLYMSMGSSL